MERCSDFRLEPPKAAMPVHSGKSVPPCGPESASLPRVYLKTGGMLNWGILFRRGPFLLAEADTRRGRLRSRRLRRRYAASANLDETQSGFPETH